jgi:hypothetical protein
VVQGGTISASGTNERSGRADLIARYGGGAYGIVTGLALSTASGLTLDIAAGHAMCDGPVPRTATSIVLTDNQSRVYIYLSQSGSVTAVNSSLTPPAGAQVFLGSCVTNSPAGSVTGIDQSGVMYLSPFPWRATADAGPSAPGDSASLPTTIMFLHKGANDTWLWDGPAGVYKHFSGGSSGTAAIADGGTGATTAADARVNLGVPLVDVITINPANGTNTVSATDSQASTILLTGGTASAEFTLELTTNGSPLVRDGHEWTIINKTSYGVKIIRNGSGLGSCWLGQGSANDQRGHFVFERDGSGSGEIRRIAKDAPSYISRVITGTLTATRGQIEAGFLVTGAQTSAQQLSIPATSGFEGQITTHQADASNYPLTVQTAGETEPDAITLLLPGEVQQVVQDSAGKNWRVGRPYHREVIIDFGSDANLTLSASQARAGTIRMQDTTVVLTAGRNVIWDTQQIAAHHQWCVVNETAQALTFKPTAAAGVTVAAGMSAMIRIDLAGVIRRMTPDVAP